MSNSGGSGGGTSVSATAHVTAAQLKNLIASPIVLAPAVTAKRYSVVAWFLRFRAGTTAYTYATGGPFSILMIGPRTVVANNESAWELVDTTLNALLQANTDIVTQFTLVGNQLNENLTPGDGIGDPLVFGNAGTVDLTLGNGTLDVGVTYQLLDF